MHTALKDPETANPGQPTGLDMTGSFVLRKVITPIILGACLLELNCAAPTVWKAEAPSPDAHWIAIARTVQSGGPGNAWIITSVSLQQASASPQPVSVLEFSCQGPVPRPYVLDNVANAGGTINLTMRWVTPTHLEVSYSGNPDLYFQAVKYAGIDISVRNASGERTTTSR